MCRILLLFFSISSCALPENAERSCNFIQNEQGQRVSWGRKLPVKFYIHSSFPNEHVEVLHVAINKWEKSTGLDLFHIMGYTNRRFDRADRINTIYWSTEWDDNRSRQGGVNRVQYFNDYIVETDININNKHFEFEWISPSNVRKMDVESVLMHELGHALGLGHNPNPMSVMYPYLSREQVKNEVNYVDVNSLSCEY